MLPVDINEILLVRNYVSEHIWIGKATWNAAEVAATTTILFYPLAPSQKPPPTLLIFL